MTVGPRVAFVDDIESQISSLDEVVRDMKAGSIYFNANPEYAVYPDTPLDTVKLLFLDLYYKKDFDPYMSANWVRKIIPKDTPYELVIWSKDTHEAKLLEPILSELHLTPSKTEYWQKSDFIQIEDLKSKVKEITQQIPYYEQITQEDFIGEILEIEDDGVLVNCNLKLGFPVFQVRKFDFDLLSKINDLKPGKFVKIMIYSKAGARLIEIIEDRQDRHEIFQVPDYFKGLEGSPFFVAE